MPKIRVMEFVESLEYGGGMERVVYDIARLLDPARFDVAVTCLTIPGEFAPFLEQRGIEVLALGKQPGRALRLPFRYARMLRTRRIDVLHMHNSGPLFTGTIAAIAGRVPGRVYTEHGRVWPDRERTMKIERALLARVDAVTAVSAASTDNLCRYLGQCEPRLRIVLNGIEDPAATPATPPADLFDGEPGPILGFIGRMEEVKGVDVLLAAMALLRDRFPTLRLLAVGTGSLDRPLQKMAAEIGIADRVRFTGLRTDVPAIFRGLDLLVLPSRSEGLPMVLLEAFGLSVPVVATRVGGTPELVEDGVTGLLVPPEDPAALADAIARALASPELRRDLGTRARRVFEEKLDARRMVAAFESIFEEVLGARGRS
jgi:glycosyltransferase involved in cell wall biosynthesis